MQITKYSLRIGKSNFDFMAYSSHLINAVTPEAKDRMIMDKDKTPSSHLFYFLLSLQFTNCIYDILVPRTAILGLWGNCYLQGIFVLHFVKVAVKVVLVEHPVREAVG